MLGNCFFSIIIPVYNKLPHLQRSITSVLNQSYQNFELIIINDASTDGSYEKLKTFESERIKLLSREVPGPGGYAARNLGIQSAKYDWLLFLDADDEWELNLLEVLNNEIILRPTLELIAWGCYIVNGNKKILDPYSQKNKGLDFKEITLIDYLQYPRPINTITVAIKKPLLLKVGGYPEGKCKRGGDVDTYIRCLEICTYAIWLNRQCSYYHTDSVNMTTSQVEDEVPYSFITTKRILKETKSYEMKKAIRIYHNSKIYNVVIRKIRKGNKIRLDLLRELHFDVFNGYSVFIKIIFVLLKRNGISLLIK